MEDYPPAFDENIKVRCQRDVSNVDLYIVIIGERYGSGEIEDNNVIRQSYTEHEFDSAITNSRKILAFIKSSGLKTDHEQLQSFITKILKRNSGIHQFEDADDLPIAVVSAVAAHFNLNVKKPIQDQTRFLCDRVSEFGSFRRLRRKNENNHIHFFITYGHRYNGLNMFVSRCIYAIKTTTPDLKSLDIEFNLNITDPNDEDKVADAIRSIIIDKISAKTQNGIIDCTADQLFECLHFEKSNWLFVTIRLFSTTMKNHEEVYKKGIRKFHDDLFASLAHDANLGTMMILFFIQVHYYDESGNEQIIKESFEKDVFLNAMNITGFSKINNIHIQEWLSENYIENNNAKIDEVLTNYFEPIPKDEKGNYYMDLAENPMKKVIDYYNKLKQSE